MTKSRKSKLNTSKTRNKDIGLDFDLEIKPATRSGVEYQDEQQLEIDRLTARLDLVQDWLDRVVGQVRVAKDNRSVLLSEESMDSLQAILDGDEDGNISDDAD